ncbi:MAG TPA: hypothetical protein VF490_19620 [Chryseosolibacter sp.]
MNRILYWALSLLPAVAIYFAGQILGSFWFVLLFLFYLFIYRPTLDVQRLLSLKKIEEKDAWRFFVPFAIDRLKYNKSLWLD